MNSSKGFDFVRPNIWFFGRSSESPGSIRWQAFRDALQNPFLCGGESRAMELDIWIDYDSKSLRRSLVPKENRLLVQIEPPSVNPKQFSRSTLRKFGFIVSEVKSDSINTLFWRSGQFSEQDMNDLENEESRFERPFFCGLINANKNSFIIGTNYPLRRDVIRHLSVLEPGFVFAGKGWAATRWSVFVADMKELAIAISSGLPLKMLSLNFRFKKVTTARYQGEPPSARDYLRNLKVAIVIENESEYFSEKLTDALYSRCHVIYVGASVPGLATLRNVTICEAKLDSVLAAVNALKKRDHWDVVYSKSELQVLQDLSVHKSNRKFVDLLQDAVFPRIVKRK